MSTRIATRICSLEPFTQNWTITDVLAYLENDTHCHDRTLLVPLLEIEAALSSTTGGPAWMSPPSTVAVVRSIALRTRNNRALRDLRLGDLA